MTSHLSFCSFPEAFQAFGRIIFGLVLIFEVAFETEQWCPRIAKVKQLEGFLLR